MRGRSRILPTAGLVLVASLAGAVSTSGRQAGVEYIAHASFLIESSTGSRVLIDPYASRVWLGYDFPDRVAADAVLITHPHYDHDAGQRRGRAFPWPAIEPITAAVAPKVLVPMHYRIGALESDPDSPGDLGPIDPWLEGKENVVRLAGNTTSWAAADLPDSMKIVVFRHSPEIPAG